MDSVGTLGTWLRVDVVDVMKSFTSSVPFMVNKRSFLPTQFDDGDLKTAAHKSRPFNVSNIGAYPPSTDHERDDGEGGEDDGVPVLGDEAPDRHDAVVGEEELPQGEQGAQRVNLPADKED